MRAVWSGTINFVLVNIPVRLFPAAEDKRVHFRNLCGVCDTPINIKRWCPRCEKEVPYENINKGFPVEKDRFVVFAPKELEALEPEQAVRQLSEVLSNSFVEYCYNASIAYDK